MENASNITITIEGGGSSSGARRVCKDRTDPDHVDIGDMSRNWKSSEALLLDDDYTWECSNSKIRVTQIQVGTDGLAVVVSKGGRARDCLTSAEVGGLTLAMLHWMFTDWRLGRS
ncbi:sphX, partial [Symbiodinium sp. CCMP2456]